MAAPGETHVVGAGSYTVKRNQDGTLGVDYFINGKPTTNTNFRLVTGANTGQIESDVRGNFPQGTRAPATTAAPVATTSGGGGSSGQVRPWIPTLDINSIYQSAASSAAGQANSWYQSNLNEFLKYVGNKRNLSQTQLDLTTKDLEQQLSQLVEGNNIGRGRVTEDTAYNMGRISTEEQARQKGEARQFDAQRRGLQNQLGASGLATSGLGSQQVQESSYERQLIEQKQARSIDDAKKMQQQTLSRTFEDLALSEKHKGESNAIGVAKAKLTFDDAINSLMEEERTGRVTLENQRAATQSSLEQAARLEKYINYFNSLKTPAQQVEAANTYGRFFGV